MLRITCIIMYVAIAITYLITKDVSLIPIMCMLAVVA